MKPLHHPTQTIQHEIGADETVPLFDFTNLGVGDDGRPIEYPTLEYYGFDHGKKTAELARHILSEFGEDVATQQNHRALWAAGFFHDIGRTQPWHAEDPGHAQRSAAILERILRADTTTWADAHLRETACVLVANHGTKPTSDPLAIALWDADHFEAARILPGDPTVLKHLKSRTSQSVLITPFAQRKDTLKQWMTYRGWSM